MRTKKNQSNGSAEKTVKAIRRATRRQYAAEEKIRIVLEGLRGEESIAELCRREQINQNLYYRWSKEFLEAGSIAENTRRSYGTALARIDAWAGGRPLDDHAIAAYFADLHVNGRAPSTISLVAAALRFRASMTNAPDPVGPIAQRTLSGIRRKGRERGRGRWRGQRLRTLAQGRLGTVAGRVPHGNVKRINLFLAPRKKRAGVAIVASRNFEGPLFVKWHCLEASLSRFP